MPPARCRGCRGFPLRFAPWGPALAGPRCPVPAESGCRRGWGGICAAWLITEFNLQPSLHATVPVTSAEAAFMCK